MKSIWCYRGVYLLIFVTFVVVNRATLSEVFSVKETAYNPSMSPEQIVAEAESLIASQKVVSTDPEDYFRWLDRLTLIRGECSPHYKYNAAQTVAARSCRIALSHSNDMVYAMQLSYVDKYSRKKMAEVARIYQKNHPKPTVFPDRDTAGWWHNLAQLYLNSLAFMFMFFLLRLEACGFSLRLELCAPWRPFLATAFWPIAIFKYPDGEPAQQFVRALRFVTFALASSLSCFAAGGIPAKKGNSGKKKESFSGFLNKSINHIAIDAFPATSSGVYKAEISPEYGWSVDTAHGRFSGFGFFEWRHQIPWFTNHSVNYTPLTRQLPFVSLSSEQGGGPSGAFLQIGGKANLNRTPFIKNITQKAFSTFVIGRFAKVAGTRVPNETPLVWETKPLCVGPVKLWSEGFYRIRGHGRSNYGQPQFWIRHKKIPHLYFGSEIEVSGGKFMPLFGLRFAVR